MGHDLSPPLQPALTPWWGEHEVPVGQARLWQIGPLTITLARLPGEWRMYLVRSDDQLESQVQVGLQVAAESERDHDGPIQDVRRLAFSSSSTTISLLPRMADLPVVSRPEIPVVIPPGEQTTVYITTPLALALSCEQRPLSELPIPVPRKTWFGTAEEGEVAYASKTFCRMDPAELVVRPHRAATAITIRNAGTEALPLRRILLPVGRLSLSFGGGQLWTDDVYLSSTEDGRLAQLELKPHDFSAQGADPSSVVSLGGPRIDLRSNPLVRVFAPLLDL